MNAFSFRHSLNLALAVLVAAPVTACASGNGGRTTVTTVPVAAPVSTEHVLLADDFEAYSPHWRQVRGQWALVGGNLLQARDDARELNAMMFYDPLTVADADITTDVSFIDDLPRHLLADDGDLMVSKRLVSGAGLVFRYQDPENFYMFRTAGEEGVVLGKVVKGEWHELTNPRAMDFAGVRLRPDTTYTLRVRVMGSRIQAWINGKAVANIEDGSFGTGRIGLATFRSKAAFESLQVVER